jgi:hypothetical protein
MKIVFYKFYQHKFNKETYITQFSTLRREIVKVCAKNLHDFVVMT